MRVSVSANINLDEVYSKVELFKPRKQCTDYLRLEIKSLLEDIINGVAISDGMMDLEEYAIATLVDDGYASSKAPKEGDL